MMKRPIQSSRLLAACLLALLCISNISAYPMVAEVPEQEEKCIQFQIPNDDDAHMIFIAIPSSISLNVEEWFVNQAYQMTKNRSELDGALPRRMEGEPEEDILNEMNKFMDSKGRHSGVTLKVQKPKHPRPLRQQELSWFNPVVMNHVERFHNKKQQWDPNNKLEGWSICFESTADEQIHIAYDIVLVSENPADDDETGGAPLKKHLTPLEEELAGSISAAQSILNEMRYMEKREARMRLTADSINDRIRYFSYISIGVLLTITYLQVSYLKRYFKKKKLM